MSTAGALANKFYRRARSVEAALKQGLRNAVVKIDNAQIDNLKSGASPGDYPIPVRTGNLLQGHFFKTIGNLSALVGNTTSYAINVHEGTGANQVHGRRPFLDDAVESVDVTGEVRQQLQKKVFAL